MFTNKEIERMLFLDIETVSATAKLDELSPEMQALWSKKADTLRSRSGVDTRDAELYPERAAIFAEFGKIVCVSTGYVRFGGAEPQIRLKSFYGENEKELLWQFSDILSKWSAATGAALCAHNGKEFDFPYLGRRYLINSIPVPGLLAVQGKKPWEVPYIDTMELWKFGDRKSYTGLELLATIFGIPSPKDDISGSDVGRVFWEENDVEKIKVYCEKDVITTIQLMMKFCGKELVSPMNMLSV